MKALAAGKGRRASMNTVARAEAPLDEWRRSLEPIGWRRVAGWSEITLVSIFAPPFALVSIFALPLAPLTLGISFSFLVIAPVDLRIKWRHPERFGQDTMINLEQAGALLIIPLVSLIATFGTSWAFYVWSQGLRRTAGGTCGSAFGCMSNWEAGRAILGSTIVSAATLIVLFWRTITRHIGGVEVMPFIADVDPEKGIEELKRLRRVRHTDMLPFVRANAAFAATAMAEGARRGASLRRLPVSQAWGAVLQRGHVPRLMLLALVSTAWIVVFFLLFVRPVALVGTGLVAMSFFTVLFTAAANAQYSYRVYLMAEQRIDVLSKRLQVKIQDESQARVVDALVERADVRLAHIEQVLQHMSEKDAPGPRGTAIAWLAQRRCRKS
jgi:hypothetical protein